MEKIIMKITKARDAAHKAAPFKKTRGAAAKFTARTPLSVTTLFYAENLRK